MKKIFALVLLCAGLSFALAPSYDITQGNYEWARDTVISSSLLDTVKTYTGNAKDSLTIVSYFRPQSGWDYILLRDALTGGTDSICLRVNVICYNNEKVAMYNVNIDSFTAAAGEAVRIPFGGSLIGNYFTIKLYGYTANSVAGVIVNRVSIWKRRVIDQVKNW